MTVVTSRLFLILLHRIASRLEMRRLASLSHSEGFLAVFMPHLPPFLALVCSEALFSGILNKSWVCEVEGLKILVLNTRVRVEGNSQQVLVFTRLLSTGGTSVPLQCCSGGCPSKSDCRVSVSAEQFVHALSAQLQPPRSHCCKSF